MLNHYFAKYKKQWFAIVKFDKSLNRYFAKFLYSKKQWFNIVKFDKLPFPARPKYSFHPTDSTANPKVVYVVVFEIYKKLHFDVFFDSVIFKIDTFFGLILFP